MDAPPDNTIQSVGMVRAEDLGVERVGRFSDPQIRLQQEPNKRIIRRFVMGEQPIFFSPPARSKQPPHKRNSPKTADDPRPLPSRCRTTGAFR